MVLVDTSVWISHLKRANKELQNLLLEGYVFVHPFVIGEIACGRLKHRDEILTYLSALPQSKFVDHIEIFYFIGKQKLMGTGLGYIDTHLLASCLLTDIQLWTEDKVLRDTSKEFDIQF